MLNIKVQLFTALWPLANPTVTVPYALFNLYLAQIVFGLLWIVKVVAHPYHKAPFAIAVGVYLALTLLELGVTMTYRMERPFVMATDAKNPSPEDTVIFGSWIVFNWVRPLIARGQKNKLEYADVWDLATPMKSETAHREAQEMTCVPCNSSEITNLMSTPVAD